MQGSCLGPLGPRRQRLPKLGRLRASGKMLGQPLAASASALPVPLALARDDARMVLPVMLEL